MAAKALEGSLEGAPNPTAYAAIITAAHDFCVSTLTQYGAVHHGHLGPPIALCALHRAQPPRQGKVHSHLMTAPHNQSWPTYITPHAMDAKSATSTSCAMYGVVTRVGTSAWYTRAARVGWAVENFRDVYIEIRFHHKGDFGFGFGL